jgi:hypothetical protein
VYLDRVLHLDPNGDVIEGSVELILENTTDEVVDVVFEEEIPKTVLEHLEMDDIQVGSSVEVTILDEDPRYEVRVAGFAFGLRDTIATTGTDKLLEINRASKEATGIDFLQVFVPEEKIEEIVSQKLDSHVKWLMHATAREWEFARRAGECVKLSSGSDPANLSREATECNWHLVMDFPDKFTTDICQEESLIANPYNPLNERHRGNPKLKEVQSRACQHVIEHNPDNCMSYQSTKAQLDCLYNTHTTNTRGCQMLAKLDPDEIFGSLDCMDEVDTDHALLCVQNYPDRKDREHCCAPVPDYLKDLCMEGPPPDKKAAEGDAGGDAGGQEGKKEGGSGKPGGDKTVYDIDAWFPESEADALCKRFAHIVPDYTLKLAEAFSFDDSSGVHVAQLRCTFDGPDYSGEGYNNRFVVSVQAYNSADLAARGRREICINPDRQDIQACFSAELKTWESSNTTLVTGSIVHENTFISVNHHAASEEAARGIVVEALQEAIAIIKEKQTLTLDEVLGEE